MPLTLCQRALVCDRRAHTNSCIACKRSTQSCWQAIPGAARRGIQAAWGQVIDVATFAELWQQGEASGPFDAALGSRDAVLYLQVRDGRHEVVVVVILVALDGARARVADKVTLCRQARNSEGAPDGASDAERPRAWLAHCHITTMLWTLATPRVMTSDRVHREVHFL